MRILDVKKGDTRFAVTETEGWSQIDFGKTRAEAIKIGRKYDRMRYDVTIIKGYSKGTESYSVYIRK